MPSLRINPAKAGRVGLNLYLNAKIDSGCQLVNIVLITSLEMWINLDGLERRGNFAPCQYETENLALMSFGGHLSHPHNLCEINHKI